MPKTGNSTPPGILGLAACLCALTLALPGDARAQRARHLSGPSSRPAAEIAREHLRARHAEIGIEAADLEDAVERRYETRRHGTTHVHLRQRVRGIEVEGGDLGLAVDRAGRVFARWSRFVRDARRRVNTRRPVLDARQALAHAAEALSLGSAAPGAQLEPASGPARAQVLAGGTLSRDEIPARLVYQPHANDLRLAWSVVIRTLDGRHWWHARIDASSGSLLAKTDWVARESYRVVAHPNTSPDDGPRTLESTPAEATASPFGWHDTNGIAGAEFLDTQGNNVRAQEDVNANDIGGFRPSGGAGLVFDHPLDLGAAPSSYLSASVTNLFYWTNIAHDLFYGYGFDEASGNFQTNNYGRGGTGTDPLLADAQDGADIDNAQFGTPPEGSSPRMEMFLFSASTRVEVLSPAGIAGLYEAGTAQFGPTLDATGVTGLVVQALDPIDGAGPTTTDACAALTNAGAVSGNLALVDRGSCNFTVKVKNAQDAGATGVIIVNNVGDDIVTMTGTDPSIIIPSLFVGQSDGQAIAAVPGVNAALRGLPMRDGGLDASIIVHEFAHGVTNRLTGGAANVGCLDLEQSAGMGEGWSDFFALALTALPGDASSDGRGIGNYALADSPEGPGIRTLPYSTDLLVNDLTLADIVTQSGPHGVGEVWGIALWEVYWRLVQAHGFDADLYAGSGGNNLAIQLVMDALKLQICDPTFIHARDALLLADMNLTGGANECLIWSGFAKRGLGSLASVAANPDVLTATEDFSVPAQCATFCGDGSVQAGEQCDDANLIPLDGCGSGCRIENTQTFSGVAQGGSIDLVIEGVALQVTTTLGQTAAQVAAQVAAAIQADATLAGLGVGAVAVGNDVVITGSIDQVGIHDPGLLPQVPMGPLVPIALFIGLPVAGALGLRSVAARRARTQ